MGLARANQLGRRGLLTLALMAITAVCGAAWVAVLVTQSGWHGLVEPVLKLSLAVTGLLVGFVPWTLRRTETVTCTNVLRVFTVVAASAIAVGVWANGVTAPASLVCYGMVVVGAVAGGASEAIVAGKVGPLVLTWNLILVLYLTALVGVASPALAGDLPRPVVSAVVATLAVIGFHGAFVRERQALATGVQ